MNGMNLDFRVVEIWLRDWEKNSKATRTASQMAAVMVNKMREESEKRLSRLEKLMKDIFKENCVLEELTRRFIAHFQSNDGADKVQSAELKKHRQRMTAIMREADAVMKEPKEDHSIKTGGLLLEIRSGEAPVQKATGPWGKERRVQRKDQTDFQNVRREAKKHRRGGKNMASDLNQVKIDGRLVDTPKINELGSGARVATLKVANNRYYKGKEDPDWKEKTGFFEVEAWNALADSVANMTKGQPVHIEGALGQDRWTDDEKKQHSRIVIEATKIEVRELKRERSEEREESGMEL